MYRMPNQKIIWLLSSVKSETEAKYNDYSRRYNATNSPVEEKELLKKADVVIAENRKVKEYLTRYNNLFLELSCNGNGNITRVLIAINQLEAEVIRKYLTKELESKLKVKKDMYTILSLENSHIKKEICADVVMSVLSACGFVFLLNAAPMLAEPFKKAMCVVGEVFITAGGLIYAGDIVQKLRLKESDENTIASLDILGSNDYLNDMGIKPHM